VEAITAAGLRDRVKILIGGAPVTQGFCDEIGADGYSPDAASAAELATSMLAA
jgi:5-methyltetrahydrofolate--homocysteine methyltransferase